jgi:murein L,D-transpeptidase YcbB/YkuD
MGRAAWRILSAAAITTLTTAPAVAARWSDGDVRELRAVAASVADEGLDPADYPADALADPAAIGTPAFDARADALALALAHDFLEGHRNPGPDWAITRGAIDYRGWLDDVLASHSVRASFRRLLPTSIGYAALRRALADCARDCARLRVNLDRWRALPRSFGTRYLWVNIPAFRLDLIEDGRVIASHRIVVGKPGTRTPVFKAAVTGVTVNPWWNVPASIVAESVGALVRTNPAEAARRGYVATTDSAGKLAVRQKPGPQNALGRIKLEMPNPYSVFIHDTPSRGLFDQDRRALSHGCIRTEDPQALAAMLLQPGQNQQVGLLLATGATQTLRIAPPIPVYVVYFTAEPDPDANGALAVHEDIYRRDSR